LGREVRDVLWEAPAAARCRCRDEEASSSGDIEAHYSRVDYGTLGSRTAARCRRAATRRYGGKEAGCMRVDVEA